ncbi:hypothetical protein Tco_0539574 [Tanacetum coccineum]
MSCKAFQEQHADRRAKEQEELDALGINGQTDIAWNGPIEEVARSQALEAEGLLSHLRIQAIEGSVCHEGLDTDYPYVLRGGFGGGTDMPNEFYSRKRERSRHNSNENAPHVLRVAQVETIDEDSGLLLLCC